MWSGVLTQDHQSLNPNWRTITKTCLIHFSQQVSYLETRPKCNCDARQPIVTSDRGYITNKVVKRTQKISNNQWRHVLFDLTDFQKLLPVKSFNYGYMTSKWQKANVTIGPMICSGGGVLNQILNFSRFEVLSNRLRISCSL